MVSVFDRMTDGRFTSLPRSELAAAIYDALDEKVETIFDDSIEGIDDVGDEVRVRFERTPARAFDLVIGADGLHSQVRRLVFGDDARFEKFIALKVAAFTVQGYRPRDELVYVVHSDVGQQIGRFALRGDRTMFLLVFADPSPDIPSAISAQKAILRDKFGESGWECAAILDALDGAEDFYFDRVSQIQMDHWTKGRVALVGDAAFCVSLLGGQGSALAMLGAYILAGELHRARGNYEAAFTEYERRLHSFIGAKQTTAVKFAPFFAPRSRFGISFRNQVMKLAAIPFVARLAIWRQFADEMELPEYGGTTADALAG
jgi:2-polyprenyl-6-methoxyphenol hydroxylase-like FAD-dependent oxidoreductase